MSQLHAFDIEESARYEAAATNVRDALNRGDLAAALTFSTEYHDILVWDGYHLSGDAWGLASLEQIVNSELGTPEERASAAFRRLMPTRPLV